MARPIGSPESLRGASNGAYSGRSTGLGAYHPSSAAYHLAPTAPNGALTQDEIMELAHLRAENGQLHQLCAELEQALHEASQHASGEDLETRLKDYEQLLQEKSQTICDLDRQLKE